MWARNWTSISNLQRSEDQRSLTVGRAKAVNVKMDLDRLQKESHSSCGPSCPCDPTDVRPCCCHRVLSLPPRPLTLDKLVWLVSRQEISVDTLSREGERYKEKILHPAFVPGNGFLKHPGISSLLLHLVCVFFLWGNLELPLLSKIRVFSKLLVFFFFFKYDLFIYTLPWAL